MLSFKGRRREVMGTGYTELFFADEPTAPAADHRPSYECRRAEAKAFAAAWARAFGLSHPPNADEMDAPFTSTAFWIRCCPLVAHMSTRCLPVPW